MSSAAVLEGDAAGYLADCAERLARSEVVAWLLKHHDSVVAATKRRTLRWEELAQRLFKDGVRNLRGGAPAGPSLRVTWYRVRKVVAEQRLEARAAAERQALEQAEEEARQEARRAAARAERSRIEAEAAAGRRKFENTQRAAQWAREREAAQSVTPPASASTGRETAGDEKGIAVRIGEVAPVFKMLKAAPLYGEDARKPPQRPYVGPRPAGMPDNLPLEALVSLEETGRDEAGNLDFQNMPGLPRRSFFESEDQWAQCCLPMIRAIPPNERSMALKLMFSWLRSFPGILNSHPTTK